MDGKIKLFNEISQSGLGLGALLVFVKLEFR